MKLEALPTISVSEFKKNPSASAHAHIGPLAVLNHNETAFYVLTPTALEEINQKLKKLNRLASNTTDYKERRQAINKIEDLILGRNWSIDAVESHLSELEILGEHVDIKRLLDERDVTQLNLSELMLLLKYLETADINFYDISAALEEEGDIRRILHHYMDHVTDEQKREHHRVVQNPCIRVLGNRTIYTKIFNRKVGACHYNAVDFNNIALGDPTSETCSKVLQIIHAAEDHPWTEMIMITDPDDIARYDGDLQHHGFTPILRRASSNHPTIAMAKLVRGSKEQKKDFAELQKAAKEHKE